MDNWIKATKFPELTIQNGDFDESEAMLGFFQNSEGETWCESVRASQFYDDETPYWIYEYDKEVVNSGNLKYYTTHPKFPEQ